MNGPLASALAATFTTVAFIACGGRSDAPISDHAADASIDASPADASAGDVLPPGVAYEVGGVYCCEKGIGRACCPPNKPCGEYGGGLHACIPAGSAISSKDACTICCDGDGTGVIFRASLVNGKCVSDETHPEEEWLCAACGDGVCNGSAGENVCSCPADCGPPP
ncbi:MAG: hypothetical protein QOI41_793 [Myxococcales bacterium]|nr:hypothetical protein [Myxococcales bacterium]